MKPSNTCVQNVMHFEGLELKAYPDPATKADPWTIGYGHTGPEVKRGLVWTKEHAVKALEEDLENFAHGVAKRIDGCPTTQKQFDALVSFAYNVGLGNLASSTLLRKHRAGDFAGAAKEFAKWNKAAGQVMEGLTTRRAAEAAIYQMKD